MLALNIAFGSNDAGEGLTSLGDVIRALPAEQLESLKEGLSGGQLVKGSKTGEAQMSTACALKIGALFTKDFKLLIGCKYQWKEKEFRKMMLGCYEVLLQNEIRFKFVQETKLGRQYNNNNNDNLSYLYRLICSVTKLLLSIKDLYITK